jgi:hypothetical protein
MKTIEVPDLRYPIIPGYCGNLKDHNTRISIQPKSFRLVTEHS